MRLLVLGGTRVPGPRGRRRRARARPRGDRLQPRHAPHARRRHAAARRPGGSDLAALATGEWDSVDRHVRLRAAPGRRPADAARAAHRPLLLRVVGVGLRAGPAPDETSPVATLDDPTVEDIGGGNYGALKALCETAADAATDGRSLAVRPGLIVGPHDPTGRFTYWPHRFARGGDVLVFDRPERPTQFVDVRDLAAWMVSACEARITGPVNVTGSWTMGELVDACLAEAPGRHSPGLGARGTARCARRGRVDGAAAVDRAELTRGGVAGVGRLLPGNGHRPDAAVLRRHRPRHAGRGRAGRRRRYSRPIESATCSRSD